MKVALAQINSGLGAFQANAEKILSFVKQAQAQGAELVVFPEAALFGYHPVDLLERHSIVADQLRELKSLHKAIPKGVAVVVGAITENQSKKGKPYWNAAVWLERGKKIKIFPKELLPTYDVFDEGRHIQPGRLEKNRIRWKGKNILLTVCEDIWAWPHTHAPQFSRYQENPLLRVPKQDIDFVINMSASPFTNEKMRDRMFVTKKTSTHFKAPMVYVNLVGAQDELIFDGASFALDSSGRVIAQNQRFNEDLQVVDFSIKNPQLKFHSESSLVTMKQALVLGLRDFIRKTGFKKVHLGLSGGVDSALVSCLAAEALGPENIGLISMPGPFSAPESEKLAQQLAHNLGCKFNVISIKELYKKSVQTFEKTFGTSEFNLMHENLQARLRGLLLMAYANRENSLLLSTSNKSEIAVGFSTLYGDMCGAIAPIGDVLKEQVYELSQLYNQSKEIIPMKILTRAPSAELRPNQKDSDRLPTYDILDESVRRLVEQFAAPRNEKENWVLNAMIKSEFKRWQAPPILKISGHAFGRGRRLPVALG